MQEEEATINMTPMLDVVFIMLIFFIVTSSFIKEAGIEVQKPEAQTAVKKERTSLLIAISRDNQIWIDRRQVDRASLKPIVEQLYAENPKGAVVIQADRESNAETVMAVVEAVRDAGVQEVAVAAEEED
ncbi:MAG: biopolymer transporter ExbD [Gammaproteobacteria bacterium]|nr:MAG: biopolymer transporter ExbD [Gammaproteobacteria bacterium]